MSFSQPGFPPTWEQNGGPNKKGFSFTLRKSSYPSSNPMIMSRNVSRPAKFPSLHPLPSSHPGSGSQSKLSHRNGQALITISCPGTPGSARTTLISRKRTQTHWKLTKVTERYEFHPFSRYISWQYAHSTVWKFYPPHARWIVDDWMSFNERLRIEVLSLASIFIQSA